MNIPCTNMIAGTVLGTVEELFSVKGNQSKVLKSVSLGEHKRFLNDIDDFAAITNGQIVLTKDLDQETDCRATKCIQIDIRVSVGCCA